MPIDDVPPDDELESISVLMLPAVFERIEHHRVARRRRRIAAFAACGGAILVSGALVGATILAPVFNPGNGQYYPHGKFEAATFAITCHTTTSAHDPGMTQQYDSQGDINAAVSDFDATCESIEYQATLTNAIGQSAVKQHSAGIRCGEIVVNGDQTAQWSFPASPGSRNLTFVTNPKTRIVTPPSQSPGCGPTIAISVPHTSFGPFAACALASNWVEVYPRGTETAAAVCAHQNEQVWNS